jgi:hypothetical protein
MLKCPLDEGLSPSKKTLPSPAMQKTLLPHAKRNPASLKLVYLPSDF